jgi:malonate transporter and related proteins
MIESFMTLLPAFVMVALGYWLGMVNVVPASSSKAFSAMVFYVAMPAFLFIKTATVPDLSSIPSGYLSAFAAVQIGIGVFAMSVLLRRRYNISQSMLGAMGSCYTNSAFMGMPIVIMLYGSALPIIIVNIYQVTLLTTIILFTQEIVRADEDREKVHAGKHALTLFKTIFLNPIILASLTGLIVACAGVEVPKPLFDILEFVGVPGIPLALFALGLSLSNKEYTSNNKNRDVYFLILLKSLIQPAAAYIAGKYMFGLSSEWLGPLVICAALPTAVNNYVFAERYGHFQAETRDIVFYTSLLSLPIITVIFTLLR